MKEKLFLSLPELVNTIGISEVSIRRYIRSGEIPHYRFGAKYLFKLEEVLLWMEDNCKTKNPYVSKEIKSRKKNVKEL